MAMSSASIKTVADTPMDYNFADFVPQRSILALVEGCCKGLSDSFGSFRTCPLPR